jgi:hypothetical protein
MGELPLNDRRYGVSQCTLQDARIDLDIRDLIRGFSAEPIAHFVVNEGSV